MSGARAFRQGGDMADKKLKNIIKSFLNNSDYLSEGRIHKLVYLAEIRKIKSENQRLTNAKYEPAIDGIYSEDIAMALGELEEVKSDWVLVGGQKITKFNGDGYDVDLDPADAKIVSDVCDNYCELTEKELSDEVKSTVIYGQTKFGDYVDFNQIIE